MTRTLMVVAVSRKSFAGLNDPQRINDLWAYLKPFNADSSIKH
jgi:cytochrome c2